MWQAYCNPPAARPQRRRVPRRFMATRKKNEAPPAPEGQAFAGLMQQMTHLPQISPTALAQLQADYLKQASTLWNSALGQREAPAASDRRFAAPEWQANPLASFMTQLYLLNSRTLQQMAASVEADDKTRARIKFAVQQFVDAASPSNFLALNPEAQKLALESQGETLARGMQHLWGDVQRGHVSQTDEKAFEVGKNVATTAGDVVFENELFQLIEYTPLTAQVKTRPLLMVPPCINKFYILDLQPDNSLIRYAVAEGNRVFVVSWRNPDEEVKHLTWDDYVETGAIEAIRVAQEISGQKQINTLGFCVGGTILATALAVLAARGEQPAASVTLLTTLLDFSDNGVLDIFVDEASVRMREATLGPACPKGPQLLHGQELATTFSFLRPNDLVWNYVVGNYLKGEAPPAFDLLYWNSDATNLPGPMYCWYLRHTYLQNDLKEPGKLTVCGEPVDFGRIEAPAFIYGSREDHIVPWHAAYRSTQLLKGKKRFVLGASGHIAGVINPPPKPGKPPKRSHWIGKGATLPAEAEAWFSNATEHTGSWWPDWSAWLASHAGEAKATPKAPGNRKFKSIEPAPGRYVKVKA
ncbi:MAG: class I poly(R)-hydroxyalkanoic acid synthase [Rubrivivax sp.]|nr:MAG: class I poly(R)-hydroxyalkanoic acid synthase [Rubrivivax sp.]